MLKPRPGRIAPASARSPLGPEASRAPGSAGASPIPHAKIRRIDTSADLAEYILEKAEVAVVPGEAFGSPGYLRLSYALGDDDLVEGVTRLQKLFA